MAAAVVGTRGEPDDGGGDDTDSATGGGGDDSVTITMLPKNLGNPYFDTSTAGAKAAADEMGAELEEVGPQEATADAQVQYIDTAAQQGVNALIVSANDPNAICDSLNQARDAGTKVVTFDSDTEVDCRDVFVNQASADMMPIEIRPLRNAKRACAVRVPIRFSTMQTSELCSAWSRGMDSGHGKAGHVGWGPRPCDAFLRPAPWTNRRK